MRGWHDVYNVVVAMVPLYVPMILGLILGTVIMRAMYGSLGEKLVIQTAVLQLLLWVMILLFMLEFRRARRDFDSISATEKSGEDLEGNAGVEEIDVSVVKPSVWVLIWALLASRKKPVTRSTPLTTSEIQFCWRCYLMLLDIG
ncbi:hypothetical protein POM88_046178 [Heracleum sosnowskyi]|uniref:Uncharacterized protein n=1 Tax=Heracleum sosnowskyi TaxID=360622 RepID=A0AAD8H748_9APIA|nr:hypothetical protein POM88_046178 [Heracleum sosnowskyi]